MIIIPYRVFEIHNRDTKRNRMFFCSHKDFLLYFAVVDGQLSVMRSTSEVLYHIFGTQAQTSEELKTSQTVYVQLISNGRQILQGLDLISKRVSSSPIPPFVRFDDANRNHFVGLDQNIAEYKMLDLQGLTSMRNKIDVVKFHQNSLSFNEIFDKKKSDVRFCEEQHKQQYAMLKEKLIEYWSDELKSERNEIPFLDESFIEFYIPNYVINDPETIDVIVNYSSNNRKKRLRGEEQPITPATTKRLKKAEEPSYTQLLFEYVSNFVQ